MAPVSRAAKSAASASSLARAIQARLTASALPATKAWMENYVKSSLWRGNKSPVVRSAVRDAVEAAREIDPRSVTGRVLYDDALSLLVSKYADDKLAGMILFKEFALEDPSCRADVLYPARGDGPAKVLADIRRLFDDESTTGVHEWSTCDWLCMKVLGPYVAGVKPKEARRAAARSLMSWSSPPAPTSVWCRRAGHVSFVSYIVDKGKGNKKKKKKKNTSTSTTPISKKRKARNDDDDVGNPKQEIEEEEEEEVVATGGDELFGDGWLLVGVCGQTHITLRPTPQPLSPLSLTFFFLSFTACMSPHHGD